MVMQAKSIMETRVATVSDDASLIDVHRLFVEEEIHGAPVVQDDGRLVGVISSADLLRAVFEEHESSGTPTRYMREWMEFSSPDWIAGSADFQDRLRELRASDYMTDQLVTVPPDASIAEVARALRSNRVHRVLVVENGVLAGIISSLDLVALLEEPSSG
jgi:CBS domain-containing protein